MALVVEVVVVVQFNLTQRVYSAFHPLIKKTTKQKQKKNEERNFVFSFNHDRRTPAPNSIVHVIMLYPFMPCCIFFHILFVIPSVYIIVHCTLLSFTLLVDA